MSTKLTVGELIKLLKNLPQDAFVRAYEGECIGIVVETAKGKELDFIETEE